MNPKTVSFLPCFVLVAVVPAVAEGRWFELRVSPSHPSTNYVIPAGKVFSIMAYDAPPRSALFTAIRPEGTISAAEVSSDVSKGAFILGPGTVTLNWTGQVAPNYGFHLLTCREFDADPKPVAPVVVRLEAGTNLPALGPAAALFRAVAD
jgi:hypothetical protein